MCVRRCATTCTLCPPAFRAGFHRTWMSFSCSYQDGDWWGVIASTMPIATPILLHKVNTTYSAIHRLMKGSFLFTECSNTTPQTPMPTCWLHGSWESWPWCWHHCSRHDLAVTPVLDWTNNTKLLTPAYILSFSLSSFLSLVHSVFC